MNDNTILRIKVPAHLYESVKEQLTLKEAKSGKAHYGAGMEVVKEKKMKTPKDAVKEVGGVGGFPSSAMGIDVVDAPGDIVTKEVKKDRSLDELKAIKEKLEKKIHEMENNPKVEEKEKVEGKEELKEFDPKFQGAMDVLNSIPGVDKIAEIDPFLAGLALVGSAVGSVFAAPKISAGIKYLMSKIEDPKKKQKLAAAAAEENIDIES